MSNYITELAVIHTSLCLGYWIFLRKEQQYAQMRFYLLLSSFLALIIPLIRLPKLLFGSKEPMEIILPQVITLDANSTSPAEALTNWNFDLLIWMYLVISGLFLLHFLRNLIQLIYLKRRSVCEQFNDHYVRRVSNIKGSFTFFNWIFVSDEVDDNERNYEAILQHEKAHVTLRHTYDLVFLELFKIFFWWLPSVWLIIKEIKKIHEYQADFYALKCCDVDQYSSILISSTLKSNGLSLASSFHDGLIFKRIKAMKKQAKNVSPWKLGALASLSLVLFFVFACSEESLRETQAIAEQSGAFSDADGEVFTFVEEVPSYPGGMDALYKYVSNEIKYPKEARSGGVEGRVMVEFVVEKDGAISHVRAIEGIGAGCDQEAVRVVQNASAFTPGSQRGKKVRVRMVMPIVFKLDANKTNPDKSAQGLVIVEEVESKNGKLKVNADYVAGSWSGTIYSPDDDVLPGANIIVAGTNSGTVSDLDGTFTLKASETQDIQVSFVGYESVRLLGKANRKTN